MYRVVDVGGVTPSQMGAAAAVRREFLLDRARLHQRRCRVRLVDDPRPRLARHACRAVHAHGGGDADLQRGPSRCSAPAGDLGGREATGLGGHFDWFFLSDTTDPDIWIAEERALIALRERFGPDCRVYYRHRAKNTSRKAGNIADFVTRWGGAYPQMVVLDADSLMTGRHRHAGCAHGGRSRRRHHPDAAAHHQSQHALRARAAIRARIYGPVIASGLSAWMGRDGNYWGHNAIIRTAAFAAHCGLPDLRGGPPFGGHILSHDFVEAALIRRAGYSVTCLPTLKARTKKPAVADRRVDARPPLVPGQSAARGSCRPRGFTGRRDSIS